MFTFFFIVLSNVLSLSSYYTLVSFSLFVLKILCFRDNILKEKEKILNEELEVGNRILDVNEKLGNAYKIKTLL